MIAHILHRYLENLPVLQRYRYTALGLVLLAAGATSAGAAFWFHGVSVPVVAAVAVVLGVIILVRGIDVAYQLGRNDETQEWLERLVRMSNNRDEYAPRVDDASPDVRRGVAGAGSHRS